MVIRMTLPFSGSLKRITPLIDPGDTGLSVIKWIFLLPGLISFKSQVAVPVILSYLLYGGADLRMVVPGGRLCVKSMVFGAGALIFISTVT